MSHATPDDWMDFTWWDHALKKRHVRIRRPLLGDPGACVAAGNPRHARAAAVLTRCGHVTTGPMEVKAYDTWLAPRGLAWCEGTERLHGVHAWGRASAEGDVAALGESWLALGRCFRTGMDCGKARAPETRFEPAPPGWYVYEVRAPAEWMTAHGALSVGMGGEPARFSARGISAAGFRQFLAPLGLELRDGLVSGVVPGVSAGQRLALLRDAWVAAWEAWSAG